MKKVIYLIVVLTILSCENKKQNSFSSNSNRKNVSTTEDTYVAENSDTSSAIIQVPIDYNKHKDLLDIILLIPDSAFTSWEWSLNDRIQWYNEIKDNDFYTDDDPDYFNLSYFDPNKAGFTIVDGFWSINIYKTAENSFVVITNDIAQGYNSLNFYEVKSNTIKKYLDEKTLFSDYIELLKKKENIENCHEIFKELDYPIFDIDLTSQNKVEIKAHYWDINSGHLIRKEYENCLNGNTIIYHFNPNTKLFDVEKIYWKSKEKE